MENIRNYLGILYYLTSFVFNLGDLSKNIKKAIQQGKVIRLNGKESSEENEEPDEELEELDEKGSFRRAEKLLKKRNFSEARDLYSDILEANVLDDGAEWTWVEGFNAYRIVMSSLNKAKCHLRLGEYNEVISTIDTCLTCGAMKEGSKLNKVQMYQRLSAAYMMRMEYRASLLVCIYGLTQFKNDEKLLAIQHHINTR